MAPFWFFALLTIMLSLAQKHWIFDLDGTLLQAQHDFDAIRRELGLPEGLPILESLAKLPCEEAAAKSRKLDEIEVALAKESTAASGADELLHTLHRRGCKMAILTRNLRSNALHSLKHCGWQSYFEADFVFGRHEAAPKPSPEGILSLLNAWGAPTHDALMVGDYRFDLEAGMNAKVKSIYVDVSGSFPFAELADLCVASLSDLNERLLQNTKVPKP